MNAEQIWGSIIAQEGRSIENFKLHCAYNIEDMASWLSEQSTTETKILFYNKKVQKFKQISEVSERQQTYGYSSIEKIVATRFLDEGKIAFGMSVENIEKTVPVLLESILEK